jgi:ribose 5-phosphate isomerase A
VGIEFEQRVAAETAAELVQTGMLVGLGTGSTVAYLVPALAARHLDITCVATSPATEALAARHGLHLIAFGELDRLDLAIDGADQVDPACWLIKGGGGAHTREKIVAAAAERFIVIVSSDKLVEQLRPPVPLELEVFGLSATLHALGEVQVRAGAATTPDGGVLADYLGEFVEPAGLAARLSATPGVVSHGIFRPEMVDRVLIGRGNNVEVIANKE